MPDRDAIDIAKKLIEGAAHVFSWKTCRDRLTDNPLSLAVARFAVRLRLLAPMEWHEFNGPMLRGAFGNALHSVDAHGAYAAVFDEGTDAASPRPFRLWNCEGLHAELPEGALIEFNFDLYGRNAVRFTPAVVEAWKRAARRGLGEKRKPAVLVDIQPLRPPGFPYPKVATLEDWIEPGYYFETIHFLSPTALKSEGAERKPTPRLVVESAVRRLSAFCGVPLVPPQTDVWWEWLESRRLEFNRKSSRAGEGKLQGWIGIARFEGEIDADAALALKVGQVLGVGRHTVFGLGCYELV